MLHASELDRLFAKAVAVIFAGKFAREDHLERDQAVEPVLPCFVDDTHAAATKFRDNLVAWHGHFPIGTRSDCRRAVGCGGRRLHHRLKRLGGLAHQSWRSRRRQRSEHGRSGLNRLARTAVFLDRVDVGECHLLQRDMQNELPPDRGRMSGKSPSIFFRVDFLSTFCPQHVLAIGQVDDCFGVASQDRIALQPFFDGSVLSSRPGTALIGPHERDALSWR
jgi:hypothetical protein